MPLPPLLILQSEDDYRNHYEATCCRAGIITFDGIRVFFDRGRFEHAFFESTRRDGIKDQFSEVRAQRMDWIRATLENPVADLFQGWDQKWQRYDAGSRVCVVYEDFVVIIRLKLTGNGELRGRFLTCYQADNSIGKIRESKRWTREECLRNLARYRNKSGR